jgi:1-acyl-sn-glycerol-3-phosphate acyltransferase
MVYTVSRFLCLIFCKITVGLKAFGRENFPKKGPCIVAANHVSFLDPVVLGVAAPRKVIFVARDDLFIHPVFRWWLNSCGVIPLKRSSADLSAIKEAMKHLAKGEVLAMFPEGTRKGDNLPDKPFAGVAFLAAKMNAPVVPAFIQGTDTALPKGAKSVKRTQVNVRFGKQIRIERRLPYQESANLIMAEIQNLSCLSR